MLQGFESGMVGKKRDELLAHHAGGAENSDWDRWHTATKKKADAAKPASAGFTLDDLLISGRAQLLRQRWPAFDRSSAFG